MKVIQVPCRLDTGLRGGQDLAVDSLARELRTRGLEIVGAAPWRENRKESHSGLLVRFFARQESFTDLRELYGEGDPVAAQAFAEILDDEKPELVHLHSFGLRVSLLLAQQIKRRNIPLVYTYNTPEHSCPRGTLLRWGKEVCTGELNLSRCTPCHLQGFGLPRPVAELVARAPASVGVWARTLGRSGKIVTALRMRELLDLKQTVFKSFLTLVDHFLAPSEWVRDLLELNGVAREKITISRYPVTQGFPSEALRSHPPPPPPLSLVYLGRIHPTKGIHLLIRAFRKLPNLSLRLDIYGMSHLGSASPWLQYLKKLAANDVRIIFREPVPPEEVLQVLRGYHLLAVPSEWLETGPQVVSEAFAAGIPVVGSNLGGISEMVQNEVDGLLVDALSVDAWVKALRRLCEERGLLEQLRGGVRPPKPIRETAREIEALYRSLITAKSEKDSLLSPSTGSLV